MDYYKIKLMKMPQTTQVVVFQMFILFFPIIRKVIFFAEIPYQGASYWVVCFLSAPLASHNPI